MHEQCDAVVVCSERDRNRLQARSSSVRYTCVPNGVDTAFFARQEGEEERHALVYTGAFDYAPNADAAIQFVANVLPRLYRDYPDARLYLVGKDPGRAVRALASDRVIVTGTVDDVRPYMARAQVFVVPLRVGQGTRLKVVEAMAMRKAIVSTPVGAEGIACTNGEDILIANDPEETVTAIGRLFEDNALRQRLGEAARRLAVERYDWSLWGDTMDKVYDEAVRHARERSAARAG